MERIPVKKLDSALSVTLNGVADTGVPVLVTRHNVPALVLVEVDHFEQLAKQARAGGDPPAWWCGNCCRPVELGEEAWRNLSGGKSVCRQCGAALEAA